MRVVSLDATTLVVHNGCDSIDQGKWATLVLVLGFFCIYFTVSKVVGNLVYFWIIILFQVFIFLLICWFLSPVITTFDKMKETVIIEKFSLFITKINEYSLSDIQSVQIKNTALPNRLSTIYLVLSSGDCLYLSNLLHNKNTSQKVLLVIKNFLAKNEYAKELP